MIGLENDITSKIFNRVASDNGKGGGIRGGDCEEGKGIGRWWEKKIGRAEEEVCPK